MRRVRLLLSLLWLCAPWLPALPALAAAQPAATTTAEQWRVFEITLTSTQPYDNPFTAVSVTAVFTSPTGQPLTRPGFWDGGDTWKVRVALTERGRWTYQVRASDPANAGLNPPAAAVLCTPYTGRLEIYQHGFLSVSANGRYLQHADGTPFFWLGDTHWFFDSKERWDASNDPRWPSEFRALVDRRLTQGFSVYQSVIFGPAANYWVGAPGERLNPAYFREQLDPKLAYLADHGLVNALGLGFHSNIDGHADALAQLAQYVVARYGAYPMVWITGGEVGGSDPDLRPARLDGWRQVALAIDAADDYHQPQTAHYTPDFPTDYQAESWFDFTMLQGGHNPSVVDTRNYQRYYQARPPKPMLEAEANYEGLYPWATADLVRASAYRAIQSGSFGYTYGAQGIWNAVWDDADTVADFSEFHRNWNQAIDFPGGQQMAYLARFYRRVPWATLQPRSHGLVQYAPELIDQNRPLVTADADANNLVAYLPAAFDPVNAPLTFINLPDQTYNVRWYNPRTGVWLYQGRARTGLGTWVLEPKPDGNDWLVWLQATRPLPADSAVARAAAQPNLALGQVVVSSSDADAEQAAALAFDGDLQTHWQPTAASAAPHWLEVNFAEPVTFNTATISEDDFRTRAYQLEVWDGAGWVIAYRGTLIGHLEPHLIQFAPQTTTRARLVFTRTAQTPFLREWALLSLPDLQQARSGWKR